MAVTDQIADMLTRIRNALTAKHETVEVPASKTKKAIADVTTIIGPNGKEHWTIEGNYEEKDWQQFQTDPYSSPRLSIFFDEYKK